MKKLSKILVTILALSLMLGALVVLSSANTAPALTAANVSYGDTLTLAFQVNGAGNDETAGILVYTDKATYELDNKNYKFSNFVASKDGDVEFYETQAIAPKDYETTFYIVPVTMNEAGEITYGEGIEYGVKTYFEARLADEDNITPDQKNLYEKTLTYCAAAKAVLSK